MLLMVRPKNKHHVWEVINHEISTRPVYYKLPAADAVDEVIPAESSLPRFEAKAGEDYFGLNEGSDYEPGDLLVCGRLVEFRVKREGDVPPFTDRSLLTDANVCLVEPVSGWSHVYGRGKIYSWIEEERESPGDEQ